MTQNRRYHANIDFSNMSGGKNNAQPQTAIRDNQLYDCSNAILHQKGFTRAPGMVGIDTEAALPSYARMFDFYKKADGTE